jgi:hypothetical protein
MAAFVFIALIPAFAMILAKGVTHAYADRYAISGVIGAFILCVFLFNRVSQQLNILAYATALFAFICFASNAYTTRKSNFYTLVDVRSDRALLSRDSSNRPVVVDEVTVFHRLSFYAAPKLAGRLVYVADPSAAVKYIDQDTIDRGLLELRPWFPINVVPMQEYVATHTAFLVYGYVGDWTWLTYELGKPGVKTRLIDRKSSQLLFSVDGASPLAGTFETHSARMSNLYQKFENRKQSLCAIYMGPNHCPVL